MELDGVKEERADHPLPTSAWQQTVLSDATEAELVAKGSLIQVGA